MDLWLYTLAHLQKTKDADGNALFASARQGVAFPMADALCWLLSARQLILDVVELAEKGADDPVLSEALPGLVSFYTDLCHHQCASAAGEVARICTELAYGYNRHPSWTGEAEHCFHEEELEALEAIMPGIGAAAVAQGDLIEDSGKHTEKAGPCARFDGLETFRRLRTKLDGCLTGARLAKDRAARALVEMSIPEALDYPS
jgi:hypothetical protein